MAALGPVSWRELISGLRLFGFAGPYSGGKHLFMIRGSLRLAIPNPQRTEIGIELLSRILKQAEISKTDWLKRK